MLLMEFVDAVLLTLKTFLDNSIKTTFVKTICTKGFYVVEMAPLILNLN